MLKVGVCFPSGRAQPRRQRSIIPEAPTLAPWLADITGTAIKYRAATSVEKQREGGPSFVERDTKDIGRALESCLIAAHMAKPALGLVQQATDADGNLIWLAASKKLGKTEPGPKMGGFGSHLGAYQSPSAIPVRYQDRAMTGALSR